MDHLSTPQHDHAMQMSYRKDTTFDLDVEISIQLDSSEISILNCIEFYS